MRWLTSGSSLLDQVPLVTEVALLAAFIARGNSPSSARVGAFGAGVEMRVPPEAGLQVQERLAVEMAPESLLTLREVEHSHRDKFWLFRM